jgi:preprotein translocase subunit SecB
MNDTSSGNGQGQPAAAAQTGPRIAIRAQYVKDLSFENPNALSALTPTGKAPKLDVSVGVNARNLGEDNHEVELQITARANRDDSVVFLVELKYAGVFNITGLPAEQLQAVVMVECPRLLFPFARRIIADCARDGGYPPLLLEPIDFMRLFVEHQKRAQAEAAPAETN